MRSQLILSAAVVVTIASMSMAATGPSTTQTPYLIPLLPGSQAFSILSAGDSVNNKPDGSAYKMAGIPDGLGAFDNGDGTMTVLMNHELGSTAGITRAHGGKGAFVSKWIINTTTGSNFLKVNNGSDLMQSVVTAPGLSTSLDHNRFCSADLPEAGAFYNSSTGMGTTTRLFMNGEEGGTNRAYAHDVSTGVSYQLGAFGNTGGWENLIAHPNLGDKTLVMANADGGTGTGNNKVFAYLGTKTNTGSVIDKAGLTNGTTYQVKVTVNGNAVASESVTNALGSGSPVYTGRFSLDTNFASTTTFLRPEDGAWDTRNSNDYYFVTTNQYDQVKDGVGAQVGRSRLWRMRYDNANNPTAGGTIEALLDGTEAGQMYDNITVVPGVDGRTRVLLQEDVGGNAHNGKIWLYDTSTDSLTLVAMHDAARFGDIGLAATAPFSNDEEFSGIIDARDTLGLGWFLLVDQAHYTTGISSEVVEGGQLIAFYLPQAVPEPTGAAGALGTAALLAGRRRRA